MKKRLFSLKGEQMRTTSKQAYKEIIDDGTLSKRQEEVYKIVYQYGPISGRKIDTMVKGGWKRLSELERMKVIRPEKAPRDEITGKHAILWVVTGNAPIKAPRPEIMSRKDLQAELLKYQWKCAEAYDNGYRQAIRDILNNSVPAEMVEAFNA